MKYFLFISLTIATVLNSSGFQTGNDLYFHMDKKVYFTGEGIWYSGYISESKSIDIAYVQIINEYGDNVMNHKLMPEKNIISGYIKIPENLTSDRYIITVRTKNNSHSEYFWILNASNDEETILKILNKGFDKSADLTSHNIDLSAGTFNPVRREQNTLSISVNDENGNPVEGTFSISIQDKTQLGKSVFTSGNVRPFIATVPESGYNSPLYINGRLLKADGSPVSLESGIVLQLMVGKKGFSILVENDGYFSIPMEDEFYGVQEIFFLNYEELKYVGLDYKLEFEGVDDPVLFEQKNSRVVGDILGFLNNYKKKKTIENAFLKEKRYSRPDISNEFVSGVQLTDEPDQIVVVDNYVSLPNLREVFREIVSTIKVRYVDEKYEMRIFSDELNRYYDNNPLVIIDNIPQPNLEAVMELEPKNLDKIKVIDNSNKLFSYGFPARSGIVFIETFSGNYQSDVPRYLVTGFHKYPGFILPDYKDESLNEAPNLNTTIFWHPAISTGSNGKATVEFFNSDNVKEYVANILFIDKQGNPTSFSKEIYSADSN